MHCKLAMTLGAGDVSVARELDGAVIDLTPDQIEEYADILRSRAAELRERQAMEAIEAGHLYLFLCEQPFYVQAHHDPARGTVFLPADKYGAITSRKPITVFPYSYLVKMKSQGNMAAAASFLNMELIPVV